MPILIPRGNMALYKAMVKAYGGIAPGINNVTWSIALHPATHVAEHLKVFRYVHDREFLDQFNDFYDWYLYPVDLPGKLYLWAVEHLFVKNELFKGELKLAGKTMGLRSITCPAFLLGGEEDDTTPWQQVHNMRDAVGSSLVRWYLAPDGHIGLFIGHRSQAEYWTPILAQVRKLSRPGGITNATSTSIRSAGSASAKGNGKSNAQRVQAIRPDQVLARAPWLTDEESVVCIMAGLEKSGRARSSYSCWLLPDHVRPPWRNLVMIGAIRAGLSISVT
jgi:PHB depolymerase-like protein